MYADCHTHTKISPCGEHSALQMCGFAVENGISVLCISDHCECNRYYETEFYTRNPNDFDIYNNKALFEESMRAISAAKESFAGQLKLLTAVELGQPTFDIEAAEQVIADKRLDYVIGSMHQIPNCDDFCGLSYSSKKSVQRQLEIYFREIVKLCKWGKFNILAHMTYPIRYIEGDFGIKTDLSPYEEMIREALKIIIQKGIALEINSSGLRQKYGGLFPTVKIIKTYAELGGEFVSLGSDSHSGVYIGSGFPTAAKTALDCGIKYGVYYENRRPVYYELQDK